MCGIAGIVEFKKRQVDRQTVIDMVSSLKHRGPDDQGTLIEDNVGLGHSRLSIIDVSAKGHQPMTDSTGRYTIVFNGEIYNYPALRARLVARGHHFYSKTDTEILLALYADEGSACLDRLEGMWAFVIYDRQRKVLFGSRDRFGEKPLYYYYSGDRFAFASQPKALRVVPDIPFSLADQGIGYYLTYGYIPEPYTAWHSISKLPQGTYFELNLESPTHPEPKSYWRARDQLAPDTMLKEATIDDSIREELLRTVKERMVADVPVGAFLSGGIDSSAVVAAMAKNRAEISKLHTFSIGFDYARYDETANAQIVASAFGTIHHVQKLTSGIALDILQQLPEFYDEPFADSSMIPTFALSKLAREYVTVALSGDGADELWGGYLHYVMQAYLMAFKKRLPAVTYPLVKTSVQMLAEIIRPARSWPALALGLKGLAWIQYPEWEIFARLSSLHVDQSRDFYNQFQPAFQNTTSPDALMQAYLTTHLPNDFLVKVDRASMAYGLEVRCPFLDRRFAEFALRVPAHEKVDIKGHRYILKNALRRAITPWLPSETIRLRKKGFSLPLSQYLIKEWQPFARQHIDHLCRNYSLPMAPRQIHSIMKAHTRGVTDYSQFLYALIFLDIWLERWR